MAKDKQGKKSTKTAKKTLKKAGDAAVKLAQQPIVGELVAAALTAAAASLSQTKAAKSAARRTGEAADEAVKETAVIGQTVKRALLDAARSLLDDFDDRPKESTLARSEPANAGNGGTGKKTRGAAKG